MAQKSQNLFKLVFDFYFRVKMNNSNSVPASPRLQNFKNLTLLTLVLKIGESITDNFQSNDSMQNFNKQSRFDETSIIEEKPQENSD